MYVDSNGDFWSVFIGTGEDTLLFSGTNRFSVQYFAYTSPDCSGPPNFTNVLGQEIPLFSHVVFLDQSIDVKGIWRVRNMNSRLTTIQAQSIRDLFAQPQCTTLEEQPVPVLTLADTTVVTPPNIAVSMPLHPVFIP
jgi:hypothetical protein